MKNITQTKRHLNYNQLNNHTNKMKIRRQWESNIQQNCKGQLLFLKAKKHIKKI